MATQRRAGLHAAVGEFESLLEFHEPAAAQRAAKRLFPRQVARSRLQLRQRAEALPTTGLQVVLGVATYSTAELELLDQLNQYDAAASQVQVFDILECQSQSDVGQFIPGLSAAHQTPILGVYHDGKLTATATGLSEVRRLLRQVQVL